MEPYSNLKPILADLSMDIPILWITGYNDKRNFEYITSFVRTSAANKVKERLRSV